jgi:2-iminobutanoate/2-iminopropanoate deaminase
MAVLGTVSASQESSGRRHINLPGRTDQLPFSDAVLVGDTLYLAGRIGMTNPQTGQPPANLEAEVRIVLDGMKTVLDQAGMTMDDLVTVQVFCSDVSLYDQFNAVYRTYFSGSPPARAFLGSGTLLAGAHFEVQGIAVRR